MPLYKSEKSFVLIAVKCAVLTFGTERYIHAAVYSTTISIVYSVEHEGFTALLNTILNRKRKVLRTKG